MPYRGARCSKCRASYGFSEIPEYHELSNLDHAGIYPPMIKCLRMKCRCGHHWITKSRFQIRYFQSRQKPKKK